MTNSLIKIYLLKKNVEKQCLKRDYFNYPSNHICDFCPAKISGQLMFSCSGASYTYSLH